MGPPSSKAPPRSDWASMMAEASSARVGTKRIMSEKTMAISCPGRPTRESGESMRSKASESWVGVVVSMTSEPVTSASAKRAV